MTDSESRQRAEKKPSRTPDGSTGQGRRSRVLSSAGSRDIEIGVATGNSQWDGNYDQVRDGRLKKAGEGIVSVTWTTPSSQAVLLLRIPAVAQPASITSINRRSGTLRYSMMPNRAPYTAQA